MASFPYKPDNDERDNYFHGFSGSPKLVARTGHNHWTKSLFEWEHGWKCELAQHRKHYMALDDLDTSANGAKICRDDYYRQEGTAATILLVAVEPASLQWEDGINIALSCRDIIRKFKIFDVEVEIMEGRYTQHAASTQLEAHFDPVHQQTTKAGQGTGTVGLHVKLGADESSVYGLTCRHVVYNNRAAHESYRPSAEDRQYHIQANADTFGNILSSLESTVRKQKAEVTYCQDPIRKWDEWYQYHNPKNISPPSEFDRRLLTWKKDSLAYNTSVIEILEQIVDRKKRQIGHLAFLPSFTISPRQLGYLRDWALIELDPKKFIRGPDNRVFLDFELNHFKPEGVFERTLRLRHEDEVDLIESYPVAKRGVTTGLTFGTKSGIEAVVRQPGEGLDGDMYSWELLIVPEKGTRRFSANGDSGSAIFDLCGRVVGIVTASNGVADDGQASWRGVPNKDSSYARQSEQPEGTDITFAAPIKWVLDDIQDFTGQEVRLA